MNFKKTALITGLFLGTLGMTISSAFSDLPNTHWAYDKVIKMQEKGIISGYQDGTFRPQNKVTREEFATILSKTLGLTKNSADIKFIDVEDSRWSKEYIDAVSKYLSGYEENGEYYFKPSELAIREDMAVAVVKARGLENETPDYTVLDRFSDKNLISENAKKYVAIAVKNVIMNGNTDGTFNPKGSLTRAEITALMSNVSDEGLTIEDAKGLINKCFNMQLFAEDGDSERLHIVDTIPVLQLLGYDEFNYGFDYQYINSGIKYSDFEDRITNYISKELFAKETSFKSVNGRLYYTPCEGGWSAYVCENIELVSAKDGKNVYAVRLVDYYTYDNILEMNCYIDIIKEDNGKYVIDNICNVVDMTESGMENMLESYTNKSIKSMVIDDFNNDGYNEAFAFTSHEPSEEEIADYLSYLGAVEYYGEVWFINSKGEVSEVSSNFSTIEYDEELMKVINVGNKKYVSMISYSNGGDWTYIWGVDEENNFTTVFDDRIYLKFNDDGSIYAGCLRMDGWINNDGMHSVRSFKDYYFYIDGNEIKEYGAIEISIDKLKEFDGADEIINNITKDGEEITEILYRENNIININTEKVLESGTGYSNYTLKYDEKSVKDISKEVNADGIGTYLKAINPERATYPTISLKPTNTVSRKEMENIVERANLSECDNWFEDDFTENEYRFIDLQRFTVGDGIATSGWFRYEVTSTYNDDKIDYSAKNLSYSLNGQIPYMSLTENSWVEGVAGYGIGEKIKVTMAEEHEFVSYYRTSDEPEELCDATVKCFLEWKENGYGFENVELYNLYNTLDNIYIINGYAKNDELWKANSRVKKLKLTIDNKEEYILELNDSNELQIFDVHYKNDDIAKPIFAEYEILEVYEGEKYEDTAMSFLYTNIGNNIEWGGR